MVHTILILWKLTPNLVKNIYYRVPSTLCSCSIITTQICLPKHPKIQAP